MLIKLNGLVIIANLKQFETGIAFMHCSTIHKQRQLCERDTHWYWLKFPKYKRTVT